MMFTPQTKVGWRWPLTPHGDSQKKGGGGDSNGSNLSFKEKGLLDGTVPEPMMPALDGNNGGEMVLYEERRELMTPAEKLARLERELYEYQYNMGLLLIEKKEWNSKLEELNQALADAQEAFKREQAAYFTALTDVDKREENLRNALGVEKQCVNDLEKALHEMRAEYAEIKFTSDSKLAEANALVSSVEEKSLEVEAKLRATDAKLAEVSRKSAEIEMKLQEIAAREDALRNEYIDFSNEREAHARTFSKQRDDLREWENKLHAGEERLSEGCKILNQREERADEKDKAFKQNEIDLVKAQKQIDAAKIALKAQEEDITSRLADLSAKEKHSEALRKSLEVKEKDLIAFEEKLNLREKVQVQKVTDEHIKVLEAKRCEFEMEIEEKRKSVDEGLKSKIVEVERKEVAVNHMEEKITKKEQALEKRLEKLKDREKEYESKFKALKDWERSVKAEEKNVAKEKEQILGERGELQCSRDELEKFKGDIEKEQLKVHAEIENLSVTEEERSELQRLQAELKQEINQCRLHKELLSKESEDLRQQREIFERDWEELDKKKSGIAEELKSLQNQKEKFENTKNSEEEKLRTEKHATEAYIRRELDALELAKESHATSIEHEKSVAIEKIQAERSQLLHDLEVQRQELENDMLKRQEEMENLMRSKEKLFEETKASELKNVNYLQELAARDIEDMKLERRRLDKEKQELSENQKNVEQSQSDLRKDIDQLVSLSEKMKLQREQFVKEKERFIGFVEKHRSCEKCGEITSEFVLSDLQVVPESTSAEQYIKNGLHGKDTFTTRTDVEDVLGAGVGSPASKGTVSWLRKCTSKILRLSPIKIIESLAPESGEAPESAIHANEGGVKSLGRIEKEVETSIAFAEQSIEDVPPAKYTLQAFPEDSQPHTTDGEPKPKRKATPRVSRTRSVKAVVEDAKNIIGQDFEYSGKNTEDSSLMVSESRGESSLGDEGHPRKGRKRNRTITSHISGTDGDDCDESEGHSNSIASRQKKRQLKAAPLAEVPTGSRYNLRRPKIAAKPAKAIAGKSRGEGVMQRRSKRAPISSLGSQRESGRTTPKLQSATAEGAENGKQDVAEVTTAVSEEVNGSVDAGDQSMQDEYGSECQKNGAVDEGSSDEDEEESEHPGEASIGKKLWTFLTT